MCDMGFRLGRSRLHSPSTVVMVPSGSLRTLSGAMEEMARSHSTRWATLVRSRADEHLEDRILFSGPNDGAPEPRKLHSPSTAGCKAGRIRECLHVLQLTQGTAR
jgi:hypothetical protein